jgi:lysophospholipase L1-like esterase
MPATQSTRKSSRLSWRARLLLLAGSTLLAFAFVEVALRVAGVSYGDLYTPDPHCGSRLRPGYRGWFTKEGRAFIEINSQGLRDHEHPRRKPAGEFRVAILGDSFAEALQVPLEATFWHLLEQQLPDCEAIAGRQVESINFGVSGYGTAQELQMLRHYVWPYEPDLVLLTFYPGNDVRNNSSELESDGARPYFHLRDDELILDESFHRDPMYLAAQAYYQSWRRPVIRRSRLLQVIREVRRRRLAPPQEAATEGGEAGLDDQAYRPPRDPQWQNAWEVTDRLLTEIARECQRREVPLCVAIVTRGVEVHPDPQKRRDFRVEGERWTYPESRVIALGRKENFLVVPLTEPLREYAEHHKQYVHGFENALVGQGHWNEHGHRVVAEKLADALCELLADDTTPNDEKSPPPGARAHSVP